MYNSICCPSAATEFLNSILWMRVLFLSEQHSVVVILTTQIPPPLYVMDLLSVSLLDILDQLEIYWQH